MNRLSQLLVRGDLRQIQSFDFLGHQKANQMLEHQKVIQMLGHQKVIQKPATKIMLRLNSLVYQFSNRFWSCFQIRRRYQELGLVVLLQIQCFSFLERLERVRLLDYRKEIQRQVLYSFVHILGHQSKILHRRMELRETAELVKLTLDRLVCLFSNRFLFCFQIHRQYQELVRGV